ncbi:NAD(P)/FAD-dependent oxidoreductase [Cobetia marina]
MNNPASDSASSPSPATRGETTVTVPPNAHKVVILGGGAGGIAVAASLLKRQAGMDIAIVEPSEQHSYQPGWTMVGGGIFTPESTRRPMSTVMPKGVHWYRESVVGIDADAHEVTLGDGRKLRYERLVVAIGLELDWAAIEGLERPWARMASPPITAMISRLIPGSWCSPCAAVVRCSPSHRCRSSVPAPPRRRCTCPAITGSVKMCSVSWRSPSTTPGA